MKWKILIFSCLVIYSCQHEPSLRIESFDAQNQLAKSHEGTKSIFFLVSGYSGSEADYELIENHVCQMNRDSLFDLYKQYWLAYYQKSEKTNNENIRQKPKDFFNFSTFEDHIAEYSFSHDSLVTRRKYFLKEYPKNTELFRVYDLCK